MLETSKVSGLRSNPGDQISGENIKDVILCGP